MRTLQKLGIVTGDAARCCHADIDDCVDKLLSGSRTTTGPGQDTGTRGDRRQGKDVRASLEKCVKRGDLSCIAKQEVAARWRGASISGSTQSLTLFRTLNFAGPPAKMLVFSSLINYVKVAVKVEWAFRCAITIADRLQQCDFSAYLFTLEASAKIQQKKNSCWKADKAWSNFHYCIPYFKFILNILQAKKKWMIE